eukprot:128357_1
MAWQLCCLIESTFEPHTSPPHSPTTNRVWFLDEGNAICIIHIFNGQLHWNVHCKYAKLRLIKWCNPKQWTWLESNKYVKIINKIELQHGYHIFGSSFGYGIFKRKRW